MNLHAAAFALKSRTVRRRAGALYAELLRQQYLPPEELTDLVNRRSADMANFAARQSPFYAQNFAEVGVDLAKASGPVGWSRIPIIDRAIVKKEMARIPTPEASQRTTRAAVTGGSTGEPLRILHDTRVPKLALSWRMYGWWGVQPYDDLARVGRWAFSKSDELRNRVSWWPTRQIYLDASLIDNDSMKTFSERIIQSSPKLIEGYVGALVEFADYCATSNLRFPSVRAIATTAAPLTPEVRQRLQGVFGVPVYDEYRGSEGGWMAGECMTQQGLHVNADMVRIEIVDDDGTVLPPGEVGNIVITDLANRVFPLIRYKLGDLAAMMPDPCECGISLPKMTTPQGRTADVLRLPSGKIMNHRLMGMFGEHPESVKLFQIHQRADYSIAISVVATGAPQAREKIQSAVDALRSRVDGEVPVEVTFVDHLPYTGGKIKYVISDVVKP